MRDIEDEYHFVCVCPAYNELRQKYIPAYYRRHASVFKFINLLRSDKKNILFNLAMFIYHAGKVRKSLLMG